MRPSMLRRGGKKFSLPSCLVCAEEEVFARNGDRCALLKHGSKLILHVRRREFTLYDLVGFFLKTRICGVQFLIAQVGVSCQCERSNDERKGSKGIIGGAPEGRSIAHSRDRRALRIDPIAFDNRDFGRWRG